MCRRARKRERVGEGEGRREYGEREERRGEGAR